MRQYYVILDQSPLSIQMRELLVEYTSVDSVLVQFIRLLVRILYDLRGQPSRRIAVQSEDTDTMDISELCTYCI